MTKIKIDNITITGENPREEFDEEKLRELGGSIKAKGLLQPIIVRPASPRILRGTPLAHDYGYELVVGERRVRACQLVGIPEIEAEVRDIDDRECIELRLIENLHREDLTPSERDKAYSQYLMFIARGRGYDLSDDKQYNQLIDEASRGTGLTGDAFRKRLGTMELSEILKSAGVTVQRHIIDAVKNYPSFGVAKQVRIAKIAQKMGLTYPRTIECLKLIYRNPDKDTEKLMEDYNRRKKREKEEEAQKKKREKEKARKLKKKSGRPRKKIEPNEYLKKLSAKERKKIEEKAEKAKKGVLKREVSAREKIREKRSILRAYVRSRVDDKELRREVMEKLKPDLLGASINALKNVVDFELGVRGEPNIIHGDALVEMPRFEEGSFDCVVTDPPYLVSELGGDIKFEFRKNMKRDLAVWDYADREEFLNWCKKWIGETYRILKDGGTIYIFTSDRLVSHLVDIMKEIGFTPKTTVIWHKTNPAPSVRQKEYCSSTEYIVFATKGEGHTFNWLGQKKEKWMHNFYECPICGGKERTGHPTQKPVELVKHLLEVSTDPEDRVLDPFAGSGTTAVACDELKRHWVVIEKEKENVDIIKRRVG